MTAMFTPNGKTELPFEIPLKPKGSKPLYETYHGVFVNIQVISVYRFKDSFFLLFAIEYECVLMSESIILGQAFKLMKMYKYSKESQSFFLHSLTFLFVLLYFFHCSE